MRIVSEYDEEGDEQWISYELSIKVVVILGSNLLL